MFAALLVICVARSVYGIIVQDPLPTGGEYKYWFEVLDPTTGDSKSLHEARPGDAASGCYTALDPDGARRTVHYTTAADPYTGFKAVLVQEPITGPQGFVAFENLQTDFPPSSQYTDPYVLLQPLWPINKGYQQRKYFTPAREIPPERQPINGLYFEPNNKYE